MSLVFSVLRLTTHILFFFPRAIYECFFVPLNPTLQAKKALQRKLLSAASYSEWRSIAAQLDTMNGYEEWKREPSNDYDYRLIQARLSHLQERKDSANANNNDQLILMLRAGLLRNLGGLTNLPLYAPYLTGTKALIQDYISHVIALLYSLANSEDFNLATKREFFSELQQSHGRTALLLSGGASFGMFHLGVIKCLAENGLLPSVVHGTSVGALVASLICTLTDAQITHLEDHINLSAFTKVGSKGSIRRKVSRFLKHGYLMDIHVLEESVRDNIGDVTFLEAYKRTHRILNITVTPGSGSSRHRSPILLNYMTAPDVLVRTAACASCALAGIYDTVPLLAKAGDGSLIPWSPVTGRWTVTTFSDIAPIDRLTELFNVNNFIISQVSPHLVPLYNPPPTSSNIIKRLLSLFFSELSHRMYQLTELGFIPQFILRLRKYFGAEVHGDITIIPTIYLSDYQYLFSNPTAELVHYSVQKGEQATWPKLPFVAAKCAIECTIEVILRELSEKRKVEGKKEEFVKHVRALSSFK